jgi:hypothetical protein
MWLMKRDVEKCFGVQVNLKRGKEKRFSDHVIGEKK